MPLAMSVGETFVREFGGGGHIVTSIGSGRVNLIGEHTDYNDGFVLPMAIELTTTLAARLRTDDTVRLYSVDYSRATEFSLRERIQRVDDELWSNYPRGVLWALQQAGVELQGVDMAFGGQVPIGAGLSSSAALEVATAVALRSLLGFEMSAVRLAVLCQRAENDFVGTKCGIMDQFVSLLGKAEHALFLDCRSLEFEHIPLELGDHRVLICHSGVKRTLGTSAYNQRRQECETGTRILADRFNGITALRDVGLDQLEACRKEMSDEVYRRCRHVISENVRVLDSTVALQRRDLRALGALMNASHDSQRVDYEVSCPEIDLLVDLARKLPSVLGARITGGGFGGCTVNLVAADAIDDFRTKVVDEYARRTQLTPKLYVSIAADGARVI